jgi:murein DD-endopeptidase MepM/ murein hydrolase activator NlpD
VRSIADGTVIESGATSDGCGFGLKISHRIDGQDVASRYCHLATAPVVAVGDRVRVGQFVGLVGSSGLSFGAHLHLVVEVNGKAVDPMPFIAKYNKPPGA